MGVFEVTVREWLDSYKPSLMACVKSMEYKAPDIAKKIESVDPEIRNTKEYAITQDEYIDYTMSCDLGEAIGWMIHIGKMAIQYGLDTKNLDWKVKFIVAWDIAHRLTANDKEWVA